MKSRDSSHAAADERVGGASHASAPADFGALSRKIRSRTTDLLAVAIVVIGGLAVGSQLVRWWSTESGDGGPAPAAANVAWGAGDGPVLLEFGEGSFRLERQTLTGDREAALSRLIDHCAAAAQETRAVTTEIDPAEERLLGQLDRLTPLREQPGVWRVCLVEVPLPLVIATRTFAAEGSSAETSRNDDDAAPAADRGRRRVVCWGMAQPVREGAWVLFTMRPAGEAAEPLPEAGRVALPAGSRKILSVREASGGALIAFEGEGTAKEWQEWFSAWFAARDWKESQSWTESTDGWSAAFVPEGESGGGRIDVTFSRTGERGLTGVISVSPTVVH